MSRLRWENIALSIFSDDSVKVKTETSETITAEAAIKRVRELYNEQVASYDNSYIWLQIKKYAPEDWEAEKGKLVLQKQKQIEIERMQTNEILKEYVPSTSPAEYIPYTLPGGITDVDVIKLAVKNHKHVLLEGPTGCGKSTAIDVAHYQLGAPMWRVSAHERIEFDDLVGRWIPSNGSWRFVYGPLAIAAKYGMSIVIEEINMAVPSLISFLNSAMDNTRTVTITQSTHTPSGAEAVSEVIKVHENFIVIGTMNRGYAGTKPLNKALERRFQVKLIYPYPVYAEKILPQWVQLFSEALRRDENIRTEISFAYLKDLAENEKIFGRPAAIHMFIANFPVDERNIVKEVAKMTLGIQT